MVEEGGSGGSLGGFKEEEAERTRADPEIGVEMSGGDGGGVVVVENGTAEAVVLDCPYQLDGEDLNGLLIQWFHPSSTSAVYQWIPETKPTALRLLRDRVDLTYEASSDAFHRYRALRILEPTTDLAGSYECRVTSFSKDIRNTQELIVFTEPQGVEVWVEERDEGQVAVFCKVDEVYPQPELDLYKKSSMKDSENLGRGTPVISSSHGTYNMQVEKVVQEATLDGPTEFECHVTIPKTELRFVTSTKYQPRVSLTTGAVIGRSNTQQASTVLLAVLFLLPLLSLLYA